MIPSLKKFLLLRIFKSIYKPGSYYSTIPNPDYVESEKERLFKDEYPIAGIDLNVQGQHKWLESCETILTEFPFKKEQGPEHRYYFDNIFFNRADGLALYTVIRSFQPKTIIEVGSGFSSALMLDVNELFLKASINLTFIEPYPERLYGLLSENDKKNVTIKVNFVQDIPISFFKELNENDILFIDSSHVSKIGSDLNYLLFNVLPALKPGVIVHFHDIFYPFEYPYDWLKRGISWNEAYLLRSFLMFNTSFQVLLFNNMLGSQGIEPFKTALAHGGSLYLKKIS